MFDRRKDVGHPEENLLSVFREHGVVARGRFENHNQAAENRNIYQLVDSGWLVINRMKAWQGSVGISFQRGIVSGHYLCFRPTHNENSRYLNWLLRSPQYTNAFETLSRGVRPGQAEIDNDDLAQLPVLLPSSDEQMRIADFLDDQVHRIDNIIAARRAQSTQAGQLGLATAREILMKIQDPIAAPLSACAQIIDTEHKTAPDSEGDDYWIAGTSAIREGEIVATALREVDHSTYREWTRRGLPKPGDVLLTREAPVGHVALLNHASSRIAIGQRVVLLSLDPPTWVACRAGPNSENAPGTERIGFV